MNRQNKSLVELCCQAPKEGSLQQGLKGRKAKKGKGREKKGKEGREGKEGKGIQQIKHEQT